MTHIHYKFSSKLSYDTAVFDGPHVTLRDLKRQIMGRERLRAGDCDLRITNAQSKEEYIDDEGVIPKGSSVIVRRIPVSGGKSGSSSKTNHIDTSAVQFHHAFIKAQMDDQSSSRALPFLAKMANLAEADVSEEDKIKVMLNQSTYDSMNYKKFGCVLPANYTCYRCGNTGHHIRNCPTSGQEKNFEAPLRIRKSTGIPRSFMVEVDDPNMKGAMLTNSGRYAIPAIDAEAYAIGKKEKPPFIPQEKLVPEAVEDPVPDELLCLICRDLLSDAVVIPCCGNSYCDDCIRTTLLDSEEHVCPTCSQSDVSPDTLIANKFLRQAVNNFKKERGFTKSLKTGCGSSQSQPLTTRPSPVTTPPPIVGQSQAPKPLQPAYSQQVDQDSLQHRPNAAAAPPSSGTPAATGGAVAADDTLGTFIGPEQSCLEIPDKKAEEETRDDSVAVAAAPSVPVSVKEPSAAPPQWIAAVNHTAEAEQPQTVSMNQQQSSSSSLSVTPSPCGPPVCWDSSSCSRVWTDSQLSSSCSSYSAPTPCLFPSPIFLSAHQSHHSYPPGYQPTAPLWPVPSPQGTPIPSLCSSTSASSIPSLIPEDWYTHQRKNERSPHTESSYRQSSSRSNSKSSKSRMSHFYANSSSRSRSRSRSKSQGRSRHRSPYSRHKNLHAHYRPCSSYSYGYKRSRSPTPSSSSSPRVSYYSRSKSPSDHQKKRHHGRHQSRKPSSSSYISGRRGEQSEKETAEVAAAAALPQHTTRTDSLDLDRERYLQWKEEYKEWCEKYFSSYVGHFHQLPLPLLNLLPPPPPPQWLDRDGSNNSSSSSSHANPDSQYQARGRHTSQVERRSPSSHSSSGVRSPPSQSSSDSHSCSDSGSSPSCASPHSRSPPCPPLDNGAQLSACRQKYSQLSATRSKAVKEVIPLDRSKEDQEVNMKYPESFGTHRRDRRRLTRREKSPSPVVGAVGYDECKDKAPSSLKPNKRLDKHRERESREKLNLKGWRTGKPSNAGQDVERSHKAKPSKDADGVDTELDRNLRARERTEARSDRSRKRKGEELERRDTQRKSASPNPAERKKQHREKKKEAKAQPPTESEIWEEGIKVKPQKKISININLDGTRSKIYQDLCCSQSSTNEESEKSGNAEEGKGKPHKDASRKQEGTCEDTITAAEVEASRTWDKGTFKEVRQTLAAEAEHTGEREDEDLDLWHCALRGAALEEESGRSREERDGMRERRRLTGQREGKERKRNESHTQEETESAQHSHKEAAVAPEELTTNRKEAPTDGVKNTSRKQDDGTMRQKSRGPDDDSCEDRRGRPAVNARERPTGREGERVLAQVSLSKRDKDSVEEQDKAETTAPNAVSVTVPPPLVATASRENERSRWRSVDTERDREGQSTETGKDSRSSGLHRTTAPSGGRCRTDSSLCTKLERRRDRGRESERPRDRQKEGKVEKRARGAERGHSGTGPVRPSSGASSSSSTPHDTEKRDRQRRADQCSERNYVHPTGSERKDRCSISAAVETPDRNAYKSHRGTSLDSTPKAKQAHQGSDRETLSSKAFSLKPRVSSPRRDVQPSKSESPEEQNKVNKVMKESKPKRETGADREGGSWEDVNDANKVAGESLWDWRRELEEGERSSSRSSNSSSSASLDNRQDDGRKDRKKHKKERQADGGEDEANGGTAEEGHSRFSSDTLS